MPRGKTTIEVSNESWSALNEKKGPGDSFDDVIRRLAALSGSDIEQPEEDEGYVSGNIVLARTKQNEGTILRPSLIIRSKRANEPGDYEVAPLPKLEWGGDTTRPRARGYLSENVRTLNYNEDKIVELDEAPRWFVDD